jgi:hypothetical protein
VGSSKKGGLSGTSFQEAAFLDLGHKKAQKAHKKKISFCASCAFSWLAFLSGAP